MLGQAPRETADAASNGNRLDVGQVSDDVEVHASPILAAFAVRRISRAGAQS